MNYLHKFLEFTSVEEGEKQLKEAYAIRDQMGGAYFWNICNDDCHEIQMKLEDLRRKEKIILH